MSDHKDPKEHTGDEPLSVDDILKEYSSGRYRQEPPSNVVEFPQPEQPFDEEPPVVTPPRKKPADEPVDEIVPETVGRSVAARLSTLLRRADHYADHMYDQAEPDEATRKAEKYVPGVDKEEVPENPTRSRPIRRPLETPPDTAPGDLAKQYKKGLKSKKIRSVLAFLFALLTVPVSLDLPFFDWSNAASLPFPIELPFPLPTVRLALMGLLLLITGLLTVELIGRGFLQLFRLRLRAEVLLTFAWLFTLADTVALILLDYRPGLPCCSVTALGLAFSLIGDYNHRRGNLLSAKTAAQARTPYTVTLDESKWSGRPAYSKWSGAAVGFGSQLQMEHGVQRAYRIAAPLLLLGCLLAAGMASFGRSQPLHFLWAASFCFTASSSWSALLAFGIPYRKLATRLAKPGAAMAGWPGINRCRPSGILMTDLDLFPPGAVQVAQVRVFGGVSTEKAVAYTATLLRAFGCGLTRPFHDLLRSQGAFYREVTGLVPHEGGLSGIIRNQEVLVGTASFMRMMDVALPQGLNIKNAVFCSISGELAGMFPMQYAMSPAVNPALSTLMRENVAPILVTRDFNLIPDLLARKFKLPVGRMEFPPVLRRLELSEPNQEHDPTPVAVLCREGLSVYSDAVVGGRRLRTATRRSLTFVLLNAILGLCVTFYLTYVGAFAALTPVNFLVFMAAWLVPELLIANGVNQY